MGGSLTSLRPCLVHTAKCGKWRSSVKRSIDRKASPSRVRDTPHFTPQTLSINTILFIRLALFAHLTNVRGKSSAAPREGRHAHGKTHSVFQWRQHTTWCDYAIAGRVGAPAAFCCSPAAPMLTESLALPSLPSVMYATPLPHVG